MNRTQRRKCIKRLFDIVFSLSFMLILFPFMLLVGLCVRICSRGPILYKANRVGKDGKPFRMLKFRTMHVNTQRSPLITLRSDKRVFPFGRFLRKTKIDELPQLGNVFVGNMSIVGPRPEDIEIARNLYIDQYVHILDVRPGLTSPGSLYDYTIGETFENEEEYRRRVLANKLNLELYYIEHMSFRYDCKLIMKTIVIIIQIIFGIKFSPPEELRGITVSE